MRELTYCFLFQTTSENVTRRIALRPLGTPFAVSSSRLDTKAISNRFLKSPLMQTEQYSTSQFARDVDTCVRKCPNESEVLRWIKPLLEKLVRSPGSVPAEAFAPRKDRFAMNLIHMPRDERFSMVGGVWHPGQTTPIHDHLTWALIGVYDGEEREALLRRTQLVQTNASSFLSLITRRCASNSPGNWPIRKCLSGHGISSVTFSNTMNSAQLNEKTNPVSSSPSPLGPRKTRLVSRLSP